MASSQTHGSRWTEIRPDPGIVVLEYSNPPDGAITKASMVALAESLDRLESDTELACLIIASADATFLTDTDDADLAELRRSPNPQSELAAWHKATSRLAGFPTPTIAAVDGVASGAGLEVALCCDIRIAARGAEFRFPWSENGLLPYAGATQRLPRTIGKSAAFLALASAASLDASAALRLGLVDAVADGQTARDAAVELGRRLARSDRTLVRHLKTALAASDVPLQEGLALEARLAAAMLRKVEEDPDGT